MTDPHPMPSVRRRPIPGMASQPPAGPPPVVGPTPAPTEEPPILDRVPDPEPESSTPVRDFGGRDASPQETADQGETQRPKRRPAADYSATRLVNFRLPVDLHDRYKQLVQDSERQHPRLRHPSLTELVIALLEEAPDTVDGVAAMIRRKRADEHGNEAAA